MTLINKRKYIYFFLKLIISFFIGLGATILIMQNESWIKQHIQNKCTLDWQHYFNCRVECKVKNINLFYPNIEFEYISMKAHDGSWSWNCNQLITSFSWLDLFLYGTISTSLYLDDLKINSIFVKNKLAIWNHLLLIFNMPAWPIPTFIKSFVIDKGSLSLYDNESQIKVDLVASSETRNISGVFKTTIHFNNGKCKIRNRDVFQKLNGPTNLNIISREKNTNIVASANCTCELVNLKNYKTCFISGKWDIDHGNLSIKNQDRSLVIDPILAHRFGKTVSLDLSIRSTMENLTTLFFDDMDKIPISGNCNLNLQSQFNNSTNNIRGNFEINNLKVNDIDSFSQIKLFFKNNHQNEFHGKLSATHNNKDIIIGSVGFKQENNTVNIDLVNNAPISIPFTSFWNIPPNSAHLHISYDTSKSINGNYLCECINQKLHSKIKTAGSVKLQNNSLKTEGKINNNEYYLECLIKPKVRIVKCAYFDEEKNPLFQMTTYNKDKDKMFGHLKLPLARKMLQTLFNYDLQGQGDLKLYSMITDESLLCRLHLENGSIRIPKLYNFLNECKTTLQFIPQKKSVIIRNMKALLHKGIITCNNARLYYDDTYKPNFIYAPMIFENCLVNWEKDLFALVSGRLLFSKNEKTNFILNGLIMLEKAQLKKTIFSTDSIHKKFLQHSESFLNTNKLYINCDISLITKDPICINTPFLEANAAINLSLKENILSPKITGNIDLISGKLIFPYKPLYLHKCSFYFLPGQISDPIIEIIAKNKIQKYNISLYVNGSLLNHHISLESLPTLTEEQIISLLLAGSAKESLTLVMPALIMQNIKNIIFDWENSRLVFRNYFERLFRPFKNFYIVPGFMDQTGRGGLRGAIEIDIGERWRAFIQKNFNLTEDTRFELEYLFSDNITIRGLRDEHDDIGGEIEMRWKF